MSTLLELIDREMRTRGLVRRGQRILVAVSGGVDSMVLLRALHNLGKENKWKLTVAHLNHQLRGRSSDADERLVARTAKALGLGLVVERADVGKLAKDGGLSIEMAAREARHGFLARTAAGMKIPSVALAHHRDDQIELFFLRLLRGSGGEGLGGMKWKNASPVRIGKTKIELVRPLLAHSKESLQDYAEAERIEFREDASNASMDILRNRIRHELLPLLRQKYQASLDLVIGRSMEIARSDAEFVDLAAQKWRGRGVSNGRVFNLAGEFEQLPVAIQRRVLQLELRRKNISADFAMVEQLRMRPGEPVNVSSQISVFRDRHGEVHLRRPSNATSNGARVIAEINGWKGKIRFANNEIRWKVTAQKSFRRPTPQNGKEIFDAAKVGANVVVRHWQAGDRFQPIGMAQSVKLQDFFTNERIPRDKRHELIVATTAQNEVFWVEGMRISEQFKLTSDTRRQLLWAWKVG